MFLRDKHLKQYSVEPEVEVKVPGLARIIGGFAEYCKGTLICATTEDSLFITVNKRDDNLVIVHNSLTGENKKFSLSNPKYRKEDHFANCIKGICYCVSHEINFGMNITLGGPVMGYDTESMDCAISIGFCLALNVLGDLRFTDKRIYDVTVRALTSFCQGRCNTASILTTLSAKCGYFMAFDLKHSVISFLPDIFKDSQYGLIVTYSGIASGVMREENEELKKIAEEISSKFKTLGEKRLIEDSFTGEKRKIVKHFAEETIAADSLIKYFKNKDYQNIGRILSKNSKSIVENMDYSCPETDWLLKRSSEVSGCLGSTLLFSGQDGVIASVLNKDSLESYKAKLLDYEHFFGLKAKTSCFVPCGAPTIEKVEK